VPALQRTLIHALDRPGGRTLLAALATRRARRLTRDDVGVLYDGGWLHRVKGVFVPDGPNFDYYADTILAWSRRLARLRADVADYWFHTFTPQPGDVILDIGAGVGLDTLVFSEVVGPAGQVYSIEAHPRTFGLLQATCRHNRLTNVTACHCAITDRRGTVYAEDATDQELARVATTGGAGWLSQPVASLSLDDFCRERGVARVDLLKMNIEGAELQTIEGMRETLRITRHICIACHDFRSGEGLDLHTREPVVAFLRAAGFQISLRQDDPRDFVRDHVHAVRAS
jgi:FkbM family methyltransferase